MDQNIQQELDDIKTELRNTQAELQTLTRALEAVRDGMSSTVLTAALIERLVERLDA